MNRGGVLLWGRAIDDGHFREGGDDATMCVRSRVKDVSLITRSIMDIDIQVCAGHDCDDCGGSLQNGIQAHAISIKGLKLIMMEGFQAETLSDFLPLFTFCS